MQPITHFSKSKDSYIFWLLTEDYTTKTDIGMDYLLSNVSLVKFFKNYSTNKDITAIYIKVHFFLDWYLNIFFVANIQCSWDC